MVRGARRRGRLARPPRRRRPDGRDESADVGKGRRRDRVGRLPVLRLDEAAAAVEVSRGRDAARRAAHGDLQRHVQRRRGSGSSSRTSSISARCRRCSTSSRTRSRGLFAEQYRGKEALLESNRKALHLGRDYALANFACPIGLSIARRDAVGDRIFIDGNAAAALGAVYGGATVAAWYPITPSSSLAESFATWCRKFRTDPATGQTALRDRAGRGRARVDRHGDRRGVERRARVHRDVRPRRFADAGIPGARVFRRDPGRAVRRAARQPVDRHADAHAAGRPALLRVCVARRHQARAAAARGSARMLRVRRAGVRPRRPAADADLRHARPRHRHAGLADRAARVGRQPPARPRQGHDRARSRGGPRFRPLSRRRRRRHPVSHVSRHASGQRQLLHARHDEGPLRALHGRRSGVRRQHAAAAAQVRDGEGARAEARR